MTPRSFLFVPGDAPRKIAKALAGPADAVILDLEDSVAPAAKAEARAIVHETLTGRDAGAKGPRLWVRVNSLDSAFVDDDLAAIDGAGCDGVVLPKTLGGGCVTRLLERLTNPAPVLAIATESAAALFALDSYRHIAGGLFGLAWGAEDLSSDLGASAVRDDAGALRPPYQLARTLCLVGARAAAVEPVDTVHVDFRDHAGLEHACRQAAADGFTAKLAIHPAQIEIINRAFLPPPQAIDQASRVVAAFAAAGDAGVVSIDGVMFDRPHLKRARRLLERARAFGLV